VTYVLEGREIRRQEAAQALIFHFKKPDRSSSRFVAPNSKGLVLLCNVKLKEKGLHLHRERVSAC